MGHTKWQCRWSPTLGALEDTHQKVWGTDDYTDQERPTVFFGCYGLPDFYAIWRHKGIKEILWAGSDIRHLQNGYWLEDGGKLKLSSHSTRDITRWLGRNCGHWVENEIEREALADLSIDSRVIPSFLGDVNDFQISFKRGNKVYASVSGDDWLVYGWDKIPQLAKDNKDIQFHLYGNKTKPPFEFPRNVFVRGRVPKEQMNAEIKEMQGGLRMTEFDGFSEILAKSILMGQYPISLIEYPHVLKPENLREILNKTEPNLEGREYYRQNLNKYPWNTRF